MLLQSLQITGLFGKFNYDIDLSNQEGIGILCGVNGVGKTSILHMINGIGNSNFMELLVPTFESATFNFILNEYELEIDNRDYPDRFPGDCSEFPRLPHEAKIWIKVIKDSPGQKIPARLDLWGEISYDLDPEELKYSIDLSEEPLDPSNPPADILTREEMLETLNLPGSERPFRVFFAYLMQFFKPFFIPTQRVVFIAEEWENLIKSIETSFSQEKVDNALVLLDAFKEDALRFALASISGFFQKENPSTEQFKTLFIDLINQRFSGTILELSESEGMIFKDLKGKSIDMFKLSSGEKNLLVIFYYILFTAKGSLVLIDEPEISLHLLWQIKFIDDLMEIKKIKDVHFIVATHSPQIIADHSNLCIDLGDFPEMEEKNKE